MNTICTNICENSAAKARPRGRPFVKGDPRRNTKGRGAGRYSLPDLIKRELSRHAGGRNTSDVATIIIRALIDRAKAGDVRAAAELFDRGWGRPAQAVDVTTGGGQLPGCTPLPAIVEFVDTRSEYIRQRAAAGLPNY